MNISASPPSGMRDFLPEELARRRHVETVIRRVYETYGFLPVETPSIENLTALLGKYGDEGDQLVFRILHRRDKLSRALEKDKPEEKDLAELGLRYDLTVPLARLVANNRTLPRFFKRYQIQPVWRADRPGKGRFREFIQCDVDITGTASLIAEAEVCGAVAQVFKELGFSEFYFHLNHRQLLKCLITRAGISPAKEALVLVAVDKMDKIGEEGVLKELENRGIEKKLSEDLLTILRRNPDADEIGKIDDLANLFSDLPEAEKPLAELRELYDLLASTPAEGHLKIDAALVRGLGYYTGPIFEIKIPGLNGSLGGGGRYDGLIGMFRGEEIPAVGFAIGFERLVQAMEEKKMFKTLQSGPQLLLCRFEDVESADVLLVAKRLRAGGINVEVYPESPKIGKQLAYAESIHVPVAGIVGSNEVSQETITIKKMATGEQTTLSWEQAAEKIKSWCVIQACDK